MEPWVARLRTAAASVRETARQARETVALAHDVVQRADRVTAELEGPLLALAPQLQKLAETLDDPVVEELPDTLRQVRTDLLPVLRTLAETSERVAAVAGQTDRLTGLLDDAGRSLAGLPGAAALLGRRRPPPRVVTVDPDDR